MAGNGGLKRVQKAIDALADAVEPLEALAAARQLREAAEEVERVRAQEARAAGATWTRIGALYGTSKQNAQQRFGARSARAASEAGAD